MSASIRVSSKNFVTSLSNIATVVEAWLLSFNIGHCFCLIKPLTPKQIEKMFLKYYFSLFNKIQNRSPWYIAAYSLLLYFDWVWFSLYISIKMQREILVFFVEHWREVWNFCAWVDKYFLPTFSIVHLVTRMNIYSKEIYLKSVTFDISLFFELLNPTEFTIFILYSYRSPFGEWQIYIFSRVLSKT